MTRPAEVTAVHTRLMRLSLALPESRAYFASVDPTIPLKERILTAFEDRWFGPKTSARVAYLIRQLAFRYDPFPAALTALRRWQHIDPESRRLVCHWHVQLTDPLYRDFSGRFLPERRQSPRPAIDYATVVRWMMDQHPGRWSAASCRQFAGKLLSAAHEAGLVTSTTDPRPLAVPRVPDLALTYLLHLLRDTDFAGTLLINPYLASVGLAGLALEDRLRRLPGLSFRRMAQLEDFAWDHPDIQTWAAASLG